MTLSNIITEFAGGREGNLTHKRGFMGSKQETGRSYWYNRRRHG
ncbi:hypothetical protein [Gramella sp. AN32]|uniref:Uncharacterized protein n=1 Tax=Christiangramia antarctica TaxID=2058158 RepID=A0ABW5XCK1_9FLAO|nr:hypothetical protein [Gramella sp. AN32]